MKKSGDFKTGTFPTINQKFSINNIYSKGAIYIINFQYQLNLSTLIFHYYQILGHHFTKNQSPWIELMLKIYYIDDTLGVNVIL